MARRADWEIHIYAGADGSFTLYEDEGTNYRYEQGACATIRLILHDKGQQPVTRPVTYDGRTVMVSW